MGIDRFSAWMHKYGFGSPTGIDLVGESEGIVPSAEWKARNRREPWYTGETVIAGIGQGFWKATTLQLARATAAVAVDGMLRRLHLVAARRDGYRAPWQAMPQPAPVRISKFPDHLQAVREGMEMTTQPGGTAYVPMIGSPYPIAGKTGTAQKVSRKGAISVDPHQLPLALRHQAWFIGYAPANQPTIAVAIAVEHGGFGSTTAAPIARKIMDAWILGKQPAGPPVEGEKVGTTLFASVVSATNGVVDVAPMPQPAPQPESESP